MNHILKSDLKIQYSSLIIIPILFVGCSFLSSINESKDKEFNLLLNEGKKSFYNGNYKESIEFLENAILLKPNHQESHYFLGYSYERYSSKDGAYMLETSLDLVSKSSNHFKKVIKISPEYKGELVVLDPYSKLTAIWGSLAMAYIAKGEIDSAKWAFKKGKLEGGYYPSLIEYNKNIMTTCDKNAVLFTNGDNDTYPMWYLQFIENFRTDITVVNVSLLNAQWYIKQQKNDYPFGINNFNISMSDSSIDRLSPVLFEEELIQLNVPNDSLVPSGHIEWLLKPTYKEKALRIQDLVILNFLIENNWQRPAYFSTTVAHINMLGLNNYLQMDGLALQVIPYGGHNISEEKLEKNLLENYKFAYINDELNKYIPGMIGLYQNYLLCFYYLANGYFQSGNSIKAKEITKFMNKKMPDVPIFNDQLKSSIEELIKNL